MPKPKFLYHGSPENNMKVLMPKKTSRPTDFKEDSVVFATDVFPFALKFMVKWDDSWCNAGSFNDDHYMVISDKERFLANDKGGAVYTVPSITFKKMNRSEWFSKEKVIPIDKKHFPNALEAMIEHGVKIYFVDKDTFQKINDSDDGGYKILKAFSQ